MTKLVLRLLCSFAVILLTCHCVLAASSRSKLLRTVWIDSVTLNLTDKQNLKAILDQPINRFVVAAFDNGMTIFKTNSVIFSQMPQYQGKPDVLSIILRKAHASNKQVYAYVNCLEWQRFGSLSNGDLFWSHPELLERNLYGGCGLPADGEYASPINETVKQDLVDMVVEIHNKYPSLDGLVLRCRLAPHSPLGYSTTDRIQYIRAKQQDPVDINFQDPTNNYSDARDFVAWRMAGMQDLFHLLSSTYRRAGGRGVVATTGYADWAQLVWTQRNSTLEDWPNWCRTKLADEVFLDMPYGAEVPSSSDGADEPSVPADILLPLSNEAGSLDTVAEFEAVQNTPIDGVALLVSRNDDVTAASQFWTDILPTVELAARQREN
jgi:uncharacterized lipoprotein YddW (UPF0748 family)